MSMIAGLVIYLDYGRFDFAISQIKISSFVASLFLICLLFSLKYYFIPKQNNILVILGNNSFGIFFIHIFILMLIKKLGIFSTITNQALYATVMCLMVLAISTITIGAVRVIIGKKVTAAIFGF